MSIEEKIQSKIKELENKINQIELKHENPVKKIGLFQSILDANTSVKYENQIELLKSLLE